MNLVSAEIENYCRLHSQPVSALMAELMEFTEKNVPYPQMLSGPLVASFLSQLAALARAKRILEIGCYTGYSALAMASSLPADGELITLEISAENASIARSFFDRSDRSGAITIVGGDARKSLGKFDGLFDFIFIDADKTSYLTYLEKSLPLLSPDGLIAVDNCLWSGRVLSADQDEDTRAITEFNAAVSARKDLHKTLVPIRDGIFLISRAAFLS